MPIINNKTPNNDIKNKLDRARAKMSENFSTSSAVAAAAASVDNSSNNNNNNKNNCGVGGGNNATTNTNNNNSNNSNRGDGSSAKLPSSTSSNNGASCGAPADGPSCDHMYAPNNGTENGVANFPSEQPPQQQQQQHQEGQLQQPQQQQLSAESEVRFLKEWLALHLDLIQQQNDEILTKEKTILLLQQENEMLKERINCMEHGTPFQPHKFYKNYPKFDAEGEPLSDEMTQSSSPVDEEDSKASIRLLCDNGSGCSLELSGYELRHNHNNHHHGQHHHADYLKDGDSRDKDDSHFDDKSKINLENGLLTLPSSGGSFSVMNNSSSTGEEEHLKTLKMSIRRKRLCSGSSLLSNNDSAPEVEGNKRTRKPRKKRKRFLKDDQVLTTEEHYVTHAGDINPVRDQELAIEMATAATQTLEVPRWRIKVYGSCYSMEGTENLDDEVYNKRHSRLEIDERRRKRWDVQRIREQRVVEKLKLRQERIESGVKNDGQNQILQTLYPSPEDVRCLSITEQLPVMAFGCPIARYTPSEFNLRWLNSSNNPTRRLTANRSTRRRRR